MVEEIINVKDINVHGFSNSTIRSGKTGSGKTTAGEFEVENLYMFRGCKILDFDSSGRFENCSYSIPEDDNYNSQTYPKDQKSSIPPIKSLARSVHTSPQTCGDDSYDWFLKFIRVGHVR